MAQRSTSRSPSGAKTIAALRPTVEDPNIVEVIVGRRAVASMLRHRAESLGLAVGTRWTPQLAGRVGAAQAQELAREAAFAMLARRARSAAGLRERLLAAGHGAEAAEAAIEAMRADGWIDDAAFAAERARELQRRAPLAAPALAARLEEEGVAAREAARVARAAAPEDPQSLLRREARAARRARESAARVAGRFARRGYDPDTIREALEAAGYELDPS